MAKYATLAEAMAAGDELAEVELRYELLAAVFEAVPNLRGNLNPALERAKAEIVRLRASKQPSGESATDGRVVPFDTSRFRKSSG
ncbi:hypothetical protein [Mycolicibacterium gilvum]|uniref:hypothetical protein n=1 Tax=Mycolicibacterium gilvum TaxID=1804 RepID=UPI004046735E